MGIVQGRVIGQSAPPVAVAVDNPGRTTETDPGEAEQPAAAVKTNVAIVDMPGLVVSLDVVSLEELDVDQVIQEHRKWLSRLRQLVTTQSGAEFVDTCKDAHKCMLGQWLATKKPSSFKDPTMYEYLTRQHERFHAESGPLLELSLTDPAQAIKHFDNSDSPINNVSRVLIRTLSKMHEKQRSPHKQDKVEAWASNQAVAPVSHRETTPSEPQKCNCKDEEDEKTEGTTGHAVMPGLVMSIEAVSLEELDLNQVVLAHKTWLGKLRELVITQTGSDFVETSRDPHRCTFGKWLVAKSPGSFKDPTIYQFLSSKHAEFHAASSSLLELSLEDPAKARKQLDDESSQVNVISRVLISTLTKMHEKQLTKAFT
eukprot:m51a1_g6376 hypothetical protein (370) ;mRNA; r:140626-142271